MTPADGVTLLNGVLGLAAILAVLEGALFLALLLILLSAVGDALDGPLSRRWGGSSGLGVGLDATSDSLSFTVAPAAVAYAVYAGSSLFWNTMLIAVLIANVVSGMLRLARYQIEDRGEQGSFSGLATPGSGLVLVAFLAVDIGGQLLGVFLPLALLLSGLMISNLDVFKLGARTIQFGAGIVSLLGIIVLGRAVAVGKLEPVLEAVMWGIFGLGLLLAVSPLLQLRLDRTDGTVHGDHD